ncbi:NFACT RNA binding domain-containing protein [Bdellovibrionota bacterium]
MFLTASDVELLAQELSRCFVGGWVQKVQATYPSGIQLTFRTKSGTERLLLFDDHRFPSMAGQKKPWANLSSDKGPLLQLAKKRLRGGRLKDLAQISKDRIIKLDFGETFLVIECIERFANIYLLNQDEQILACHHSPRVPLKLQEVYSAPKAPVGKVEKTTFSKGVSISEEILKGISDVLSEEAKREQLKVLKRDLKQRKTLVEKLGKDLKATEDAEKLRHEGELLKTVVHEIPPYSSSVQVTDYEADPPEMRTIKLDPKVDPHRYVEQLFRRYKKLSRAKDEIEKRIKILNSEVEKIKIKIEDIQSGRQTPQIKKEEPPKRKREVSGPRKFQSSSGLWILVARNAIQGANMIRQAKGNDLWLHVLNAPGPHVLIHREKRKPIPKETIVEAAALAIYFSSVRKQGRGDVSFAECRYIKLIKGGEGKVTYSRSETIAVKVDEDRLKPILSKKPK